MPAMKKLLSIILLSGWFSSFAQSATDTLSNPILSHGADPWITIDGETFHYCYVRKDSIFLKSVKKISDLKTCPELLIWTSPKETRYCKEVWAPELHHFDNRWYVYFAADDGKNENHRMHYLISENNSVNSRYTYSGQITSPDNKWAIDGSPFIYKGKYYFIWSGWEGDSNVSQNIYIAEMDGPAKIKSARTLISSPHYDWEKRGSGNGLPTINEGPQILQKNDQLFIVYSAGGSWSNYYCLGMLALEGTDPLLANVWKKSTQPVFEGNDSVVSPGHCSFITIKQKEYIVYHSARQKNAGWDRQVNIQAWKWENGKPLLGNPIPYGQKFIISY